MDINLVEVSVYTAGVNKISNLYFYPKCEWSVAGKLPVTLLKLTEVSLR